MRFLPLFLVFVLAACGSGADAPDPVALEEAMDKSVEQLAQADETATAELGSTTSADGTVDLKAATSAEVLDYIRDNPAQIKVVNFWATWCVPCREEFPDLVRFANDYQDRGVDVIFVSADFPDQEPQAITFLREQGAKGVSFLKNEGDDAFISAFDTEWMGELPATMIYGADDERVAVWHGKTTYDAVSQKVDSLLNQI